MQTEVSVAVNFVISYLYNKLPRRRVHMFGEELDKAFKNRFAGHWYPDQPLKGTAYRCVRVSGELADTIIFEAAKEVGLDVQEIFIYLPEDLTLWIDPTEVSYRIGEKGQVKLLFSEKQNTEASVESTTSNYSEFNPDAKIFMPSSSDGLIQCFNQLNVSNTSVASQQNGQNGMNSYLDMTKSNSNPNLITAAAFAQTKFGSTKLRNQSKRPSRLNSGQDFRGFNSNSNGKKQRYPFIGNPCFQQHVMNRSLSLSPGNIPLDWQLTPQSSIFTPQNFLSISVPGMSDNHSNSSSQQASPSRSAEMGYTNSNNSAQGHLLLAK